MADQFERLKTALTDRYAIERELGAGGMATVYLAEDVKHHRQVAVKVLRPELAAALGVERFLREIEIAARLHHPHILPLYDSGEADGLLYYVMPYEGGHSLRVKLAREGELPVPDTVRILRDIVDALAHAHAHDVVHRDIKPDNVMLSGRHALVTDFGVAKAVSEATGREKLTTAGVALGTPAYMAPEQAVGDPHIDHRADIYAVGALAYELLTGRPPFIGGTSQMILSAHVTEVPEPVTKHRGAVPPALAQVVMRCLEKKAADRWQSADELLPQLEALATPSGGMTPTDTRPLTAAVGRRRGFLRGVLAAALLIVIAVVLFRITAPRSIRITTSNIRQVTSDPGLEFQPALSPDGKEVVYVVGTLSTSRVVVRSTVNISSGGEMRLDEGIPGRHWYPTWTPDGASIRYTVCDPECEWREVGKLGGTSATIGVPTDPFGTHSWSPDGSRAVFTREPDSIFAYSTEDTEPQLLGVQPIDPWTPHSFAWSPDGQLLAYVNANDQWRWSGNVAGSSIWIIDANGGEPVAITSEEHGNLSPQWLPDSRHLLFVSNMDGPRGIYVVEVGPDGPLGEVQSVAASTDPHSISVSADGKKLAYSKFQLKQNIWSIPIPRSEVLSIRDAQPVTTGNQVIESHGLSPDGRSITYDGSRLGSSDIYRVPLDGGIPQLVVDLPGDAFAPDWSPDGTEIAFSAAATAETLAGIFVVSATGGDPRLIADLPGNDARPIWSSDGLNIAFMSRSWRENEPYRVWIVSRERAGGAWGDPVRLTDFPCSRPDWAPDGESLVCRAGTEFVIVAKSGDVVRRIDTKMALAYSPRFAHDGSAIYFLGRESDEWGIWSMPVSGGDPTKLVACDDPFMEVLIRGNVSPLTVGPDHFYVTVGEYESDIWVMDLEW